MINIVTVGSRNGAMGLGHRLPNFSRPSIGASVIEISPLSASSDPVVSQITSAPLVVEHLH